MSQLDRAPIAKNRRADSQEPNMQSKPRTSQRPKALMPTLIWIREHMTSVYNVDVRRYIDYCRGHNVNALAPTTEQWGQFLSEFAASYASPSADDDSCKCGPDVKPAQPRKSARPRLGAVQRCASAIAKFFQQQGLTSPTSTYFHKCLIRGFARAEKRTRNLKGIMG